MTRFAILLLLALGLGACGSGAPVTFENHSDYDLEAVELSGSGFKASLGVVSPGQSRTVYVYPSGESGLAVSFSVKGQSYNHGPQGYFEGGGMYRVSATVGRDLGVSVQGDTRP